MILPFPPCEAMIAPANDTPALPRPDQAGRLRTHAALQRDTTRPATRLILSAGKCAARVEASLSRAS